MSGKGSIHCSSQPAFLDRQPLVCGDLCDVYAVDIQPLLRLAQVWPQTLFEEGIGKTLSIDMRVRIAIELAVRKMDSNPVSGVIENRPMTQREVGTSGGQVTGRR